MDETTNSILDTIIQNKQVEELAQFNPVEVISHLFKNLNPREKDVLKARYGLGGGPRETLEKIGQNFNVTRERIRQIEKNSVNRLKELAKNDPDVKIVESLITKILEQHGGIMEENHLVENVLVYPGENELNQASLLFLVSKILNDKFSKVSKRQEFLPAWKLKLADDSGHLNLINRIKEVINNNQEPLEEKLIIEKAKAGLADGLADDNLIIGSLKLAKDLKQDIFGCWGLVSWSSVTPKRMNDKIYIVLKQHAKPLHFTEIATMINDMKFDKKTAYPATVHNELILDNKYVLVGRGIYALSDWGYKPGVVVDVIADILKKENQPVSRDEIVKKVLEQRIVGKSTIYLALMNKDKFQKIDSGQYQLTDWSADSEITTV